MDERKYYTDWDDSIYGTGPTQPPKSRGGAMALLLILIIFLCGIITVLSVLNVRLFRQLQNRQEKELSISYTPETSEPSEKEPSLSQESIPAGMEMESLQLQQTPQTIENIPQDEGISLQEIYSRNIGSVVSISCSLLQSSSAGTGVILSEAGHIVTNAHVVDGAVTISVQLTDERVYYATLVGSDEVTDLAVLRIEADGLVPAQFGDSSTLRVGDAVVAIGDPLGVEFRGTYTDGIVSAINRDVEMDGRTMTLIQTNAALNSGNSGGPLINCYGQVIGINTMKIGAFTDKAGVEGLGFAIPSATVKDVVDQLIRQGYVSGRPSLGIRGEALSSFYQHYYRLPAGLYVTDVDRNSDAEAKGIQEGDLVLSVGGTRITSTEDMQAAVLRCQVGDMVETVIYRNGQQYMVELTLAEDKG